MRYIKTFEDIEYDEEFLGLKEFCKSNLIYLIDDRFKVKLYESGDGDFDGYLIQLKKEVNIPNNNDFWFSWQQISDYYISFVNRLLNEYKDYKFNTAEVYAKEKKEGRFTKQVRSIIKLEEILNNTIDPDLQIASITLNIVKK